jgi:hypothetical protein
LDPADGFVIATSATLSGSEGVLEIRLASSFVDVPLENNGNLTKDLCLIFFVMV